MGGGRLGALELFGRRWCVSPPILGTGRAIAKQENITAQQRMGEAINSGDLDALDDVMSPDVVDHDPAPDQGAGPEGFKQFFTMMRSAFPDLHVEVEHLVADDENVAFAYASRAPTRATSKASPRLASASTPAVSRSPVLPTAGSRNAGEAPRRAS